MTERGNCTCHFTRTGRSSLPVDHPLRFSGSVTASPPAASSMASNPTFICQPGPSPGIKTHSSPAAFPTNSLPPFFPPHSSPSSIYSLRAPPLPQNRYDAASGKNVAARRLTLIRSTPRQHFLIDPLTCASTPDSDAGKASGVPAGYRRLGHARSALSYRGAPRWILWLSGIRRTISSSRSRRSRPVRLQQG